MASAQAFAIINKIAEANANIVRIEINMLNERLAKLIANRVTAKDVAFQPNTLFRARYRRQHACI